MITMVSVATSGRSGASSKLETLHGDSLRDQAVRAIRSEIISGDLVAGQVYSARALASRFAVSATPVREAILDLVKDGLVSPVRNRGFRITSLSEKDLNEIFELRLFLEVPGVQNQAGKISQKDARHLSRFVQAIERHAKRGDLAGFLEADRRFHLGILDLNGNARIVQLVGHLRDQSRLYGLRALVSEGSLTLSAGEHQKILDALVGGNANAAGELMRVHLRHTRGTWAGLPENNR